MKFDFLRVTKGTWCERAKIHLGLPVTFPHVGMKLLPKPHYKGTMKLTWKSSLKAVFINIYKEKIWKLIDTSIDGSFRVSLVIEVIVCTESCCHYVSVSFCNPAMSQHSVIPTLLDFNRPHSEGIPEGNVFTGVCPFTGVAGGYPSPRLFPRSFVHSRRDTPVLPGGGGGGTAVLSGSQTRSG